MRKAQGHVSAAHSERHSGVLGGATDSDPDQDRSAQQQRKDSYSASAARFKTELASMLAGEDKASLLLFDESTRALDEPANQSLPNQLAENQGRWTLLYIAHSIGAPFLDLIMILRDDRLVQFGTHQGLLVDKSGLCH